MSSEDLNQKKRGKNTYVVYFDNLIANPDENPRKKYVGIEELAESIKNYGIKSPLKTYYDKALKKYVVIVGFRRYNAVKLLLEQGYEPNEIEIPIQTYQSVPTEEEKLVDHQISNEGQQLTILEKAEIARRWQKLGYTCTQIAEQMGYTYQMTDNFLKLSKAPDSLIELIDSGVVKSTIVINLFKKHKDFDIVELEIKSKLHEQISGKKIPGSTFNTKINETHKETIEEENEEEYFEAPKTSNSKTYSALPDDSEDFHDSKGREIKTAVPVQNKASLQERMKIFQSHLNEKRTNGEFTEEKWIILSNFLEMILFDEYDPIEILNSI